MTKLYSWRAKALSEALEDAEAALVEDGVVDIDRLVVCDLLGWCLQRDPAARPQSCDELLAHPFFGQERGPGLLHLSTFHIAAALGDLETIEPNLASKKDSDMADVLNAREPLLGRRPLHFAIGAARPAVVQLLLSQPGINIKAADDSGRSLQDHIRSARERHKGEVETDAQLGKIEDMLSAVFLKLSIPFVETLPAHINVEAVKEALEAARNLATVGSGENHKCHGFTFIVGDAAELLRKDEAEVGVYGEPSQDQYNFVACGTDRDIRTAAGFKQLQACATQDGAIIIDGQTFKVSAGNFVVTNIAKGDRDGGPARHRSASAVSQQANGSYVSKASEDVCGCTTAPPVLNATFDVFCNA